MFTLTARLWRNYILKDLSRKHEGLIPVTGITAILEHKYSLSPLQNPAIDRTIKQFHLAPTFAFPFSFKIYIFASMSTVYIPHLAPSLYIYRLKFVVHLLFT
jgi:hypothetical protein